MAETANWQKDPLALSVPRPWSLAASLLLILLIADYFVLTKPYWEAGDPDYPFQQLGWKNRTDAFDQLQYSQHVVGWKDPHVRIMNDQSVYMLAGWLYANGADPTLVNAEHPPLAKYWIGWGARLFSNALLASLIAGAVCIASLYSLARRLLGDSFSSFGVTAAVVNSKLFQSHATQTYLDIFVLAALAVGLLLIVRIIDDAHSRRRWLLALAVLSGIAFSVKWSALILVPIVGIVFLAHKARWTWFASFGVLLAAGFLAYAVSYARYFLSGHSLSDWLFLQWGILNAQASIRGGAAQPPLTIWRILVTGYCEYGNYYTANWQWFWPIVAVGGIVTSAWSLRIPCAILRAVVLWFVLYMLFFSTGPTWDRYLVPALPPAILLTAYMMKRLGTQLWRKVPSMRRRYPGAGSHPRV